MIVAIEGELTKKSPTFVFIATNSGLTYKVNVSLFTVSNLNEGKAKLFITQIIREDANLLYGFLDLDEQKMFETLIKLSGIGPSTAMAVCSTLKPNDFQKAIAEGSIDTFKVVPGIGPKSAKRIIVELSDFSLSSNEITNSIQKDALLALESLGFKKERISKILLSCKSTDLQSLIKEALKKLT